MTNPKVGLFSTLFCPYSQTFVWDEVTSHKRYDIDVYTWERQCAERFPYEHVYTVDSKPEKILARAFLYSPTRFKQIRDGHYSLLAAHFGPGSLYALPYAERLNLPLIATYHGYDVPLLWNARKYHPKYWRYWSLSQWMFRRVDRFLAASEELRNMLIDIGAPSEKVFTWRLGVRIPELSSLKPRERKLDEPYRLIQVGRFVEKKGFIYSIRAMEILKKIYGEKNRPFNVELTCIGDGECRRECEEFVQKHDLLDCVKFVNNLPQSEVFARMEAADVLLCPSIVAKNGDRESGILVAKEAGARCVPVIGTYHGGIPEIIDEGKTGFIVQERDGAAIARHLETLLTNEELRRDMGMAARKKIETEYCLEKRVEVLETHYDEVIAQKAGRSK